MLTGSPFLALVLAMLANNRGCESIFSLDVVFVSLWLSVVIVYNLSGNAPAHAIALYFAPVFVIAWQRGLLLGFFCCAASAIVAAIGESLSEKIITGVSWVAFAAYLKLCLVVFGAKVSKFFYGIGKNFIINE